MTPGLVTMPPAALAQSAAAAPPDAAAGLSLPGVVAPYMGVFFVAFFVSIIATPILRGLAIRNGIVDIPDLKRKNHIAPVAYLGGVGILLGWLAGVSVGYLTPPHNAAAAGLDISHVVFPVTVILGAGAIVLTGLFDDIYGISPRVKVGGQLFAAAALASQDVGLRLVEQSLSIANLDLAAWIGVEPAAWVVYLLGTVVLAVFVVGGCNAVNLLDGLDGLAAGVTGIAVFGFLVVAAIVAVRGDGPGMEGVVNDPVRIVMCLAILGGILGFLPYNFNPATVFMGDAGSLLLGYLAISTILMFSHVHLKHVTAVLIIFALPIIDTAMALIRRKVRGQPLFSPDNGHVHHQLRRRGLSVKKAVLLLYGVQGAFAAVGVTLVWLDPQWRYVLAVFVVLYAFVIVFAYKLAARDALLERMKRMHADAEPTTPRPVDRDLPEDPTHDQDAPIDDDDPAVAARRSAKPA